MSAHSASLLLVGCGKMGLALLERWREQTTHRWHLTVIEPHEESRKILSALRDVVVYGKLDELPSGFMPHCVIFAIKPQGMPQALPLYHKQFGTEPLYVSIAAGKTLSFYAQHLGQDARIVRAMPNTPAMIGMGITTLHASSKATPQDHTLATTLLSSVGEVIWLEKESLMDAATAISGSGPAYIYYFMECMIRAGMDAGLNEDIAKKLVMHTVHGSCELAFISSDSMETLRHNVTSPGGTTEAALERLMSTNGMLRLMQETVQAAIARARNLSA